MISWSCFISLCACVTSTGVPGRREKTSQAGAVCDELTHRIQEVLSNAKPRLEFHWTLDALPFQFQIAPAGVDKADEGARPG